MSTTKLKRVKTASEVGLEGITLETTTNEGGALLRATLTDVKGKRLYIETEYSMLSLNIDAPPKMVTKYLVEGTLDRNGSAKFSKTFSAKYEAEEQKTELTSEMVHAELKITEIEVPEEE